MAMGGAGFEPAKAEPTGLQPVPFDRSGIPPCAGFGVGNSSDEAPLGLVRRDEPRDEHA